LTSVREGLCFLLTSLTSIITSQGGPKHLVSVRQELCFLFWRTQKIKLSKIKILKRKILNILFEILLEYAKRGKKRRSSLRITLVGNKSQTIT